MGRLRCKHAGQAESPPPRIRGGWINAKPAENLNDAYSPHPRGMVSFGGALPYTEGFTARQVLGVAGPCVHPVVGHDDASQVGDPTLSSGWKQVTSFIFSTTSSWTRTRRLLWSMAASRWIFRLPGRGCAAQRLPAHHEHMQFAAQGRDGRQGSQWSSAASEASSSRPVIDSCLIETSLTIEPAWAMARHREFNLSSHLVCQDLTKPTPPYFEEIRTRHLVPRHRRQPTYFGKLNGFMWRRISD